MIQLNHKTRDGFLPTTNPSVRSIGDYFGIGNNAPKRSRFMKAVRRYKRSIGKSWKPLRYLALSLAAIWIIFLVYMAYKFFTILTTPAVQSTVVTAFEALKDAGFSQDLTKRSFGDKCKVGVGHVPVYTPNTNRVETWDYNIKGPLSIETFYKNYVMKSTPLLIKNSINDWPALTRWKSDAYLREKAGDQNVGVERSKNNKYGYAEKTWKQKSQKPFSYFLDVYQSKDEDGVIYYMDSEVFPNLVSDYIKPKYVPCLNDDPVPYFIDFGVWFGGGGQNSLIHNDPEDNLLNVLDGYKRLIMFAPKEGENLYEDTTGQARISRVDIAHPELDIHPLFANAKSYEVITQSGDVIFIPAYWYHQVESSCRHISINMWFDLHDSIGMYEELDIAREKENTPDYPKSIDTLNMLLKRKSSCPLVNKMDVQIKKNKKSD
ncbi:lysine-specific demethylase [Acrasis kona]|uniref:Lysine-specific demethylase n=1 Tax=Acrasis kona TaxID=1008807 RepID=A0AAW2ZIN2_9EUKA